MPELIPSQGVLKQNAILNGLSPAMSAEVLKTAKLIALKTSQQIYEAGLPIREVYFPIDSVLSVVTQMRDGGSIEVGTVGREGVSAIPLLLGATTSANESYCQVPGRAVVISSDEFRRLLDSGDEQFRGVLDRFLQGYVNMLGQLAACNGMHTVYERCARWLLLTHDRVNSEKISLARIPCNDARCAPFGRDDRRGHACAGRLHSLRARPYRYPQSGRAGGGLLRVLRRSARAVWGAIEVVTAYRGAVLV